MTAKSSDDAGDAGAVGRRRVLAGMGIGAAAAWTAPVVFSQSAGAQASGLCAGCGSTVLVNGGAEALTMVPWVVGGTHPFFVATWAGLAGFITPLPGSGAITFLGSNSTDDTIDGFMSQDVAIDPTCVGLPFTLSGDLGGIAPSNRIDLEILVEFYDGSSNFLGDGGATSLTKTVQDQSTDTMLAQSSVGVVPPGTASATVLVTWIGEGSGPLSATAAADNISLIIDCV